MDLGAILAPAIGPVIAPLVNLLAGFLVALLVQVGKKVDGVPLAEGQKGALRVTALVLSALAALVTAASNGTLATFDYATIVRPLLDTVVNMAIATGVFKLAFSK